jgi:DNA-binding beta-propeller fold protein YncE
VGTFLYVANFSDGTIDVFDRRRNQVNSFTDPGLPHGHAPFDLQVLDGKLFVTFAHRDAVHRDEFSEPEHGVIGEFDLDGTMLDRAEFHLGRRYGVGWHRRMRERIASEEFRRRQDPCL